jgi:hypothetical protein
MRPQPYKHACSIQEIPLSRGPLPFEFEAQINHLSDMVIDVSRALQHHLETVLHILNAHGAVGC